MKNKKVFSFLDVSIITIMTSLVMCFLGALLIYKHFGGINYNLLGNDKALKEFISAYDKLNEHYYDELDKSVLIDGAINGMYGVVNDPYTSFLDKDDSNLLNDTLNGKYEGIGISITKESDELIKIVEVFKDSPAEKSGLKTEDIIIKIDNIDVTNKSTEEIASLIKNGKETAITVQRGIKEITVKVKTDILYVPAVAHTILEKNNKKIGYIVLSVFNDTADVQIKKTLEELEGQGIEALILDLRSNTGGYLQIAQNIAEMFIEPGKTIYSLESKQGITHYKDKTNEKRNYEIVVLTNERSASASEILAAALKQAYGATLVGIKTYGKGKVQEKTTLSDGSSIKYTSAKWLTPNGTCIDEIGLKPDIEVEFNEESYDKTDLLSDNQLFTALDVILN